MKALIVYYSRTNTTRKVAIELADELKCDIDEIFDTKSRDGVIGYMGAGKDALTKKHTVIRDIKHNPKKYDIVIIGTPVWVGTMATPIRTYLHENSDYFKKVAFFATCGAKEDKTFMHMQDVIDKKPVVTMELLTKNVRNDNHKDALLRFATSIKKKIK